MGGVAFPGKPMEEAKELYRIEIPFLVLGQDFDSYIDKVMGFGGAGRGTMIMGPSPSVYIIVIIRNHTIESERQISNHG